MSADEARVLFETRITLESYLTQQAAFRLPDEQLHVLHELTDAFRALVASNAGERELIELDSRYHMTIYEGAQEDFLLSIVESYWSRLIRELEKPKRSREHPIAFATAHESFAEQHERILLALSNRSAVSAQQAMAQHIRSAWHTIEAAAVDEADLQPTSPWRFRPNRAAEL